MLTGVDRPQVCFIPTVSGDTLSGVVIALLTGAGLLLQAYGPGNVGRGPG